MLELTSPSPRRCDGVSRRSFLKVGSLGLAGLTLADALRARTFASGGNGTSVPDRSVILIWLDGGPPQHETYDPKPDAPAEYRGPLKAISTALPGVQVSELLPEPRAAAGQGVADPVAASRQRRSFRGGALDADRLPRVQRA